MKSPDSQFRHDEPLISPLDTLGAENDNEHNKEASTFESYFDKKLIEAGIDLDNFNSKNPKYVLSVFSESSGSRSQLFEEIGDDLHSLLSDFIRWNPEGFKEEFSNLLNFDNPEYFYRTGQILKIIRSNFVQFLMSEDEEVFVGWTEKTSSAFLGTEGIKAVLQEAVRQKKGSFLLNQLAEQVYGELFDSRGVIEPKTQGELFSLSHKQQAIFDGDDIWLLEENVTAPGHLNRAGADEVVAPLPLTSVGETRGIRLTPALLRNVYGIDANSVDLEDYRFMLGDKLRSTIESLLNISLSKLSIKEQFYLLSYLKLVTTNTVGAITDFSKEYGVSGLRSFLANSYDSSASEHIVIFGTMTEPSTARRVFGSFASSLDSTHQLVTSVDDGGIETRQLFGAFEEGMIKRAGHLFKAGKQMALSEYSGEESVEDLVQAYTGVAKLQTLLASLGDTEQLQIKRRPEREQGDPTTKTFYFSVTDKIKNESLELKATIRPEATEAGEARINIELYLDVLPESHTLRQAFHQKTEFLGTNGKKRRTIERSVIRFGFDLDRHTDPPVFSFDMGRDAHEDESMKRTGDVLGNILAQVAPTGHHLQDFDSALSDPANFQRIAQTFIKYFESIPTTPAGGER